MRGNVRLNFNGCLQIDLFLGPLGLIMWPTVPVTCALLCSSEFASF